MGGSESSAYAINNSSQVVGSSRNSSGYWRAFIKWPGTGTGVGFTDLGAGNTSYAYAINNNASPQVVGIGPAGPFFWKNDLGCKNLQDFLPAGSQWVLGSAEAINDGGQIVGFGYNTAISSYYVHGFIMTP